MLAAIARSGELGPVVGLRTTRAQWGQPHRDVDAVWILLPHDLSIALEVFGYLPAPRSAVAERVNETVTGLVSILGNENQPWFVSEVSTRYPEFRREVRLQCRDGVAILNEAYSDHIQVTRFSDPHDMAPNFERRVISTELPLLRELRTFLEYLDGGPPPRSSAAEGAANVASIAELRRLAGLDSPRRGE
jgi:predicted dehydrogenase